MGQVTHSPEAETIAIEQEAERCEDGRDILELLHRYRGSMKSWQDYLCRLMEESGLSYSQLSERSGISKNTLRKWCREGGMPRTREHFLRLGFGFSMNLVQMNRLLTRYGGYPALYPKDLFDAVCIFTLRRCEDGRRDYDYAFAEALYARCLAESPAEAAPLPETEQVMRHLWMLESAEEFTAFARGYPLLQARRPRLQQYLCDFIEVRRREAAVLEDREMSLHALIHALHIPASFEKQLSLLRTRGIVPRREPLVALCIHLGMTLDEINQALLYAGMERLCAKDKLECVLIYTLHSLSLQHPELPLGNAMQLLAVTRIPEVREQCRCLSEEYMTACYRSEKDDWGELADYVRRTLEQTDLDEAGELLRLL